MESKIEEAFEELTSIDKGNLLIQQYFPSIDVEEIISFEEWAIQVAKVRFLIEQQEKMFANAISMAFSE